MPPQAPSGKSIPKSSFKLLFPVGKTILLSVLLLLAALSYSEKINFTTADLGRHLKNGEIFLEHFKSIKTNFYSYTEPDHSGINNHWLMGVVFFLIERRMGFAGLGIFHTLLFGITLGIFFRITEKTTNFSYALFFSILSLPLITSRTEVRPEVLSYLFLGIYLWILSEVMTGKARPTILWILPLIQVFWVNMHIFFIFGLFLIGAFFLEAWGIKKDFSLTRRYLGVGVLSALVCLINPFGLEGALAPFTIFSNYGYMVAENQSVVFMQKRMPHNYLYIHFEGLFLVCILSFLLVVRRRSWRPYFLPGLLLGVFSALSWKVIRAIPLFGFLFIPLGAANLYRFMEDRFSGRNRILNKAFVLFSVVMILGAFSFKGFYYSPYTKLKNPNSFFGMMPGVNGSAEFFKKNNMEGPIFNNYDIGGYLIYHLFPKERVFVDNRPEAYPSSFFKDIYVPMQEDEAVWKKMDQRYQFNAIYFYRHDMTPWAQPFLIRRIQDPGWAPVFVDDYTLILLKRNEKNAFGIRLYELPQRLFKFDYPR